LQGVATGGVRPPGGVAGFLKTTDVVLATLRAVYGDLVDAIPDAPRRLSQIGNG
jgi:hypothetical protein